MSDNLRARLIRVAHENPGEVRREILSMLDTTALVQAVAEADQRSNYFSKLSSGMASEARKEGQSFGFRDARVALAAWFEGKEVTRGSFEDLQKQAAAWRFLTSPKGKKLASGMVNMVGDVLREAGHRPGFRDIAKVVDAFMGG